MRGELLLAAGDALAKAGSMADAKEMFLAACDIARTARLPDIFARAALGYGGSSGWQRAADDTRLVPLLEEALRASAMTDRCSGRGCSRAWRARSGTSRRSSRGRP